MFNEINKYPQMGSCEPQRLVSSSMLERLKLQKAELEERLRRVDDALQGLQANPAVADVIEKISRL